VEEAGKQGDPLLFADLAQVSGVEDAGLASKVRHRGWQHPL
jgi:hypothetical protein